MNNTNEVSEGVIGAAIDIDYGLEAEEAGVTLPDNLTNIPAGTSITFTVPSATDTSKIVDIYLNGEKIESDKAQGASITYEAPQEDSLVVLSYKDA
jgi:hypothetical protein